MTGSAEPLVRIGPSPIHGRGVFAAVDIGAGTHIGSYEGVETDCDGTHVLWVESDAGWLLIEGTGALRWLNHSPTPNAAFDGPELYAIEDIEAGVEITFDYGEEWAEAGSDAR